MNIGIGISLANYRPVPTVPLDPDAAIAALFESGEVGAWYDPSDSTTVWQDAAGTTPATVGDPVGRIDDKSGNGNHATQTTSSARPVLQQSGDLYYLDFDGVDDCLLMGDVFDDQIAVTTPGKWDLFVGAQVASDGTLIAKLGDSNHSESQRQYTAARFQSSKFALGAYWSLGTSTYTFVQTDASYSYNTNYVLRTLFNRGLVANGLPSLLAGDRFAVRVDGADSSSTVYASNGNTDSIQNGTAQLSIGGAFGTSGPLAHQADMQMYGMVMFAGLNLDSTDTATVETYLAAKSGVTLP